MPNYDGLFNAFLTILVTIDPPGLAPLFLALTGGMNRDERNQVSIRASLIAFGVMALFALAGAAILSVFGITLPAFRVAGGLLLFFIAFEMIFGKRHDRKEKTAEVAITKDLIHNIAAFPLAIPLISGPGAISATVLLSGTFQGPIAKAAADRHHRGLPGADLCGLRARGTRRSYLGRDRPVDPDEAARRAACRACRPVRR